MKDHLKDDHSDELTGKHGGSKHVRKIALANVFMKSKTLEIKKSRNLLPAASTSKPTKLDSSFIIPKTQGFLPLIDDRYKSGVT